MISTLLFEFRAFVSVSVETGGCFTNSDGLSDRASDHPFPGRTVRLFLRCFTKQSDPVGQSDFLGLLGGSPRKSDCPTAARRTKEDGVSIAVRRD